MDEHKALIKQHVMYVLNNMEERETLAPLVTEADKGEGEEDEKDNGPAKVVVVGAGAAGLAAASVLVVSGRMGFEIWAAMLGDVMCTLPPICLSLPPRTCCMLCTHAAPTMVCVTLLQNCGLEVVVLEASDYIGGRCAAAGSTQQALGPLLCTPSVAPSSSDSEADVVSKAVKLVSTLAAQQGVALPDPQLAQGSVPVFDAVLGKRVPAGVMEEAAKSVRLPLFVSFCWGCAGWRAA